MGILAQKVGPKHGGSSEHGEEPRARRAQEPRAREPRADEAVAQPVEHRLERLDVVVLPALLRTLHLDVAHLDAEHPPLAGEVAPERVVLRLRVALVAALGEHGDLPLLLDRHCKLRRLRDLEGIRLLAVPLEDCGGGCGA